MARESEEENHWPGYVDALTTMTMMLVFVMMILAVALFSITQNTSRSIVEKIADAAGIPIEGRKVDTEAMARQITEVLENQRKRPPPPIRTTDTASPLEGPERVVSAGEAERAFVPRGDVTSRQSAAVLTLTFPVRGTTIDDSAGNEIRTYLEGNRDRASHYQILATAGLEQGNATDARRLAFYRALSARTRLIAGGVPAQNIQVRVVDSRDGSAADRIEIRAMAGAPPPEKPPAER
jgi:hypothetical protein